MKRSSNNYNQRGFTLMELLVVVAIIAILIVIAIPTFSSQLNRAKKAADDANIRNANAALRIILMESTTAGLTEFNMAGWTWDADKAVFVNTSITGSEPFPNPGKSYRKYFKDLEFGRDKETDQVIRIYISGTKTSCLQNPGADIRAGWARATRDQGWDNEAIFIRENNFTTYFSNVWRGGYLGYNPVQTAD